MTQDPETARTSGITGSGRARGAPHPGHHGQEHAPEVRDHEPLIALTDGADGLSAYRAILGDLCSFLSNSGKVILEIGPTQGETVAQMMTATGLVDVQIFKDLDHRDRVVMGQRTD